MVAWWSDLKASKRCATESAVCRYLDCLQSRRPIGHWQARLLLARFVRMQPKQSFDVCVYDSMCVYLCLSVWVSKLSIYNGKACETDPPALVLRAAKGALAIRVTPPIRMIQAGAHYSWRHQVAAPRTQPAKEKRLWLLNATVNGSSTGRVAYAISWELTRCCRTMPDFVSSAPPGSPSGLRIGPRVGTRKNRMLDATSLTSGNQRITGYHDRFGNTSPDGRIQDCNSQ